MLTAPSGRSLVAMHSAKTIAVRGSTSEATTTVAFPEISGGIIAETSPSNEGSSGAMIPTTPSGSGLVLTTYGPGTELRDDTSEVYLSHQPAYQRVRSIAVFVSRIASLSSSF